MDELNQKFDELITDKSELNEVLEQFDFDTALEHEINQAIAFYQQLEIDFKAFITVRSVLNNETVK